MNAKMSSDVRQVSPGLLSYMAAAALHNYWYRLDLNQRCVL